MATLYRFNVWAFILVLPANVWISREERVGLILLLGVFLFSFYINSRINPKTRAEDVTTKRNAVRHPVLLNSFLLCSSKCLTYQSWTIPLNDMSESLYRLSYMLFQRIVGGGILSPSSFANFLCSGYSWISLARALFNADTILSFNCCMSILCFSNSEFKRSGSATCVNSISFSP